MSESEIEVKSYKIDYICDECHDGFMIFTGTMLMSNPPQYSHKCEHCGKEITFYKKYPYIANK